MENATFAVVQIVLLNYSAVVCCQTDSSSVIIASGENNFLFLFKYVKFNILMCTLAGIEFHENVK